MANFNQKIGNWLKKYNDRFKDSNEYRIKVYLLIEKINTNQEFTPEENELLLDILNDILKLKIIYSEQPERFHSLVQLLKDE